MMLFIETSIFTKSIQDYLEDDQLQQLQLSLLFRPDAGAIISGSGGLRKIRWKLPGKGKSGGIRIIYYYDLPDTIYFLFSYKKSKQEDLTKKQLQILKKIIEEELK